MKRLPKTITEITSTVIIQRIIEMQFRN